MVDKVLVHPELETDMFKLGDHDFPSKIGDDEPAKDDNKDLQTGDKTEEILALQRQLVELQQQNTDLMRFMATPRQNVVVEEPKIPSLTEADFNDLPDPVLDKKGFMSGVAQKLNSVVAGAAQAVEQRTAGRYNAASSLEKAQNEAWEALRENYPEIAKHKDIIFTANSKYANDLRAKNIIPDQALMQDIPAYVDNVAEIAASIIAEIKGVDNDDGNDGRAQVVGGRADGTGRTGRKAPKEKPANFVTEMQKIQQDMRIY